MSTDDRRSFPPEASTCELMPSGYNQIATNISSRKCKKENVRENYTSVTRWSKEVHKSIQKKDEQLERVLTTELMLSLNLSVLAKIKESGAVKFF